MMKKTSKKKEKKPVHITLVEDEEGYELIGWEPSG
jgi:hypothetical protein